MKHREYIDQDRRNKILDKYRSLVFGENGIYDELSDYMKRLCFKYVKDIDTAEDIIQNSFLNVENKIDTYDIEKYDMSKKNFIRWFSQIVVNNSKQYLKSGHSKRSRNTLKDDISNIEQLIDKSSRKKIDATYDDKERIHNALLQLIELVPHESYRSVLKLRLLGFSDRNINAMVYDGLDKAKHTYLRAINYLQKLVLNTVDYCLLEDLVNN